MNTGLPFVASVEDFGSKDKVFALDQTKVCELGVARVTAGDRLTCRNGRCCCQPGDFINERSNVKLTFAGFALGRPHAAVADQFEEAAVADVAVDPHFSAVDVRALQITGVEIGVVQAAAQKVFTFAVCGTNVTSVTV